ncbi:MAG: L,D-transpeptidase [Devosia sp.]|nr:L,D-transpeptidase [Devosia sp.]
MQFPAVAMITFAAAFASNVFFGAVGVSAQQAVIDEGAAITADAINSARLASSSADDAPLQAGPERLPDPKMVRMQILLDRAGASPGVIDGFDGENVRKAIRAFEQMRGLPADGIPDAELIAALDTGGPVVGHYAVVPEDISSIVPPIPEDYAEKAKRDFLGYQTVAEAIAERFHMDIDLLEALNPGLGFRAGEVVVVAAFGPNRSGEVASIEVDKRLRQVRAYDASGTLLTAYPATIGSDQTPTPTGTHTVQGVAIMPEYTYNPTLNFQQGSNTEILTIPPGPNGPVGTIWIDLSQPTYGIHGTPEPSLIDKTASYGCVRLTNWDAEELATMVKPGVTVTFLD